MLDAAFFDRIELMKNKQNGFAIGIVVIVIAVLALGGGAAYVATRSKSSVDVKVSENATTSAEATVNADVSQNTSIKGLLASGRSLKCTFADVTEAATTNGTVYVSGGKMRGDFSAAVDEVGTMHSHMISDGEYMHVWMDTMKQGFKMKVSGTTTTQTSQAPDINKELKYECNPWSADASLFALPAHITFSESITTGVGTGVGAKANVDANASVKGTASQCSMCDSVPAGAARDQCKAQLGCK